MKNIGEERKKGTINNGFAAIPQFVLNGLQIAHFSQSELKILLLVARLSYGCRSYHAEFLLKDLEIIGISKTHAGKIIKKLLKECWLTSGFDKNQYQINEPKFLTLVSDFTSSKVEGLRKLIGKNLFSKTSTKYTKKFTSSGSETEINREPLSSYYGNQDQPSAGQSGGKNGPTSAPSIDNDRKYSSKDRYITEPSYKDGVLLGAGLDPTRFEPKNEEEEKAYKTWMAIEPDNPTAFGYYYSAIVKKKVPFLVVDKLVKKIEQSEYLDNPGAFFVKHIQEYLKFRKEETGEEGDLF